jgi:hypothetical protein
MRFLTITTGSRSAASWRRGRNRLISVAMVFAAASIDLQATLGV